MAPHIKPPRTLCLVAAILWLAACSGSDSSSPPSTTNQSPTTAQEPTKPPPTTQPPNMAPPSTQPPGSQPAGSAPPGAFAQGTGFNSHVRTIVMALDDTHDLYAAGDFTTYNGTPANRLIRLRPNGSAAQTFGQGFNEVVIGLGLATDGSNALYAGGPFTKFNGQPVPRVIRLTANGLRDSTFQVDELFGALDFQTNYIVDLAVTEDGSRDVYVAGNIVEAVPGTPVSATAGRIVRLNPDGSPDSAFRDVRFPGVPDLTFDMVSTIAVPPGSGKVYVGGSMSVTGAPSSLLRLNTDGTIDSTFATGTGVQGILGATGVETIALTADGSRDIYAGGRITEYNGMPAFGSIRVHETGALDTSFAPAVFMIAFAIASAEDGTGDVLVSAFEPTQPTGQLRLLRFSRTGTLVPTFQQPNLGAEAGFDALVSTIVPVLDGTRDLYIGGTFTTYNGVPVNHIARIHADGSLASVVN